MTKLGLGTIGTSWITASFIDGALKTGQYELRGVYSRNEEKGKAFSDPFGEVRISTDLDEFVQREDLDVIYIASPNSLHYEQAVLALRAKKHVLVEKPASTSVEQWDEMVQVAKENGVFVLEAIRHMFIPNLAVIKEEVEKLGGVQGATLPYVRYSSRYDNVLAGEEPNIFSLNFAGGALMDLGVYPIYTAVALFGEPEESIYYARKIRTGVDGLGTVILRYKTFDVTILVGKMVTSGYEVEVYGSKETLVIDHVSNLTKARRVDHKTLEESAVTLEKQQDNDMYYEAAALADMIEKVDDEATKNRYDELTQKARIVSGLLNHLLNTADISFDSR